MNRGFTILESMVALSLIIAAVVGPFMLITRGIFSSKTAKNKVIASNLAQEGIEIIRFFRDSNLLAGCDLIDGSDADEEPDKDWRAINITGPNCTRLVGGVSPGSDWEADATYGLSVSLPAFGLGRFLKFCSSSAGNNYGLYAYGCPLDPNDTGSTLNTTFKRRINISSPGDETVCINPPGPPPCGLGTFYIISGSDRMLVQVTVTWMDGVNSRSLTQSEVMYNWR